MLSTFVYIICEGHIRKRHYITMRIFLTSLFFFVLLAIPSRWYFVCQIRHNCGDQPTAVQSIPRATSLVLMDGNSVILEDYEEFAFDSNSVAPIITANNEVFLAAVASYLKDNPDKNITITGRFTKDEKDKSSGMFENLGIARAAAIERALEKLGIDENRMSIDYAMVDGNELKEPLAFSLYIPEEKPDDYAKLQFRFEDMTFSDANFEFGKADFTPGVACLSYLDSLQIALVDDDDMILSIIGHTDNIGDDKMNHKLGLDRADNAARFIDKNYNIESSIQTESVGETEPVDPNEKPDGTDNEKGRQKNRRVNFRLIKKDSEQ
ncbi:MAG: outer membrane protein OmpA-like peptidoglycan-associated protein [Paraglaciecola sp.]|jgi:outer membrane protein OmpA-like peptidoglycan-associated protein